LTIDIFLELPFVGTKKEKIQTILKLAQIKKAVGPESNRRREIVIDLGSGDGRLLFAAAQKGARAIGYELNPFLVLLTQIRARRIDKGSVDVKRQNFWKADLSRADVIFVYSFRKTMQKFEDFVYKNAKKGTRIIANTNPFPNKKPLKSQNGFFLYII